MTSTAGACTSRPTSPTRSSTRGCCSWRSARRRPTPATPTSAPSTRSSTRCPPSDRHALVMKSTVPVRDGRLDQARLRRAGQGRLPLRLVPGVPQGGLGGARLPRARPRGRRRRRRLGRRRGRRALRAARRAARAHRHRQRRDDQAGLQRVPGHQDLVHQRDRQRLRGHRRRTSSRWPRASASTTASGPKFLQAGVGFGGSCLAGDETVLVRHHGRTTLLRLEDLWRRWRARTGPPTTASSSPSAWRSSRGRPTRPSHCSCRSCAPPAATTRATCSRCAPRWAGACAAPRTTRGWSVTVPAARSQ